MSASLKQIEEQALRLDAEERAKLAEFMLESLKEPIAEVEAAWAEEIERRVAAYHSGDISAYTAEDVIAEARRMLVLHKGKLAQEQLGKLNEADKKQLLRRLIADLDEGQDQDVKRTWLEEAQRRYKELKDGAVTAVPADEAIEKARERLRNVR